MVTERKTLAAELRRVRKELDQLYESGQRAILPRDELMSVLGLAIAKGIVEAHGGRIWAESVPGQGSTSCFSLSIAATSAVGIPAACAAE